MVVHQKLHLLKKALKEWNRDIFRDVHRKVLAAKSALEDIKKLMDSIGGL